MAAEGVLDRDLESVRRRMGVPIRPGEGEAILWEGRPEMLLRRLMELIGFLLLIGLMMWLAIELFLPGLEEASREGQVDRGTLPMILLTIIGTILIIGVPVWLRSSAHARARYMLTNRRALVWLGNRIVGEALLFGADMRVQGNEVNFVASNMVLSWRLKDEGMDRLRFEQLTSPIDVAQLAEEHGARWIDRPAAEQDGETDSAASAGPSNPADADGSDTPGKGS